MQIKGSLGAHPPYNKFLIVVGLLMIFGGLFTVLGGMLAKAIYGVDVVSDVAFQGGAIAPEVIAGFKLMQAFMSIGMFILPPFVAAWLFAAVPAEFLYLKRSPDYISGILTAALLIVAIPMINWMVEVNSQMHLPASLQSVEEWMKLKEQQAADMTAAFFEDLSWNALWVNLIIMAVIPAIGEELLFRGVIQRLFGELTNNRHLSIALTAVLFSALHMQFFGFFPRFMLGVAFGYLLVWSGSLWLPILAHFINNAGAVVFAWLSARGELPFDPNKIGAGASDVILLFLSIGMTALIFYLIQRKSEESDPLPLH